MPSKSKRLRKLREQQSVFTRFRILAWAASLIVISVVVALIFWPRPQQAPVAVASVDEAMLAKQRFIAELTATINDYSLPAQIRAKVNEIGQKNLSGELEFRIETTTTHGNKVLMLAGTHGPKPILAVHAPYFLELARVQNPQLFRSTFLSALIHEYIHLERWPETRPPTPKEILDEEVRAYGRMCLEVVRPMNKAGMWVLTDYAQLDNVLKSCGDDINCPQFREAIRNYGPR